MTTEQYGCRRDPRLSEAETKRGEERLKMQEKKEDAYERGEVSQRKVLQGM